MSHIQIENLAQCQKLPIWHKIKYKISYHFFKRRDAKNFIFQPQISQISQMQITSASEIIPLICVICGQKKSVICVFRK
jgi:hypothetical protein